MYFHCKRRDIGNDTSIYGLIMLFMKMWLLYAQFEIRQKELATARKVLWTAIGKCPKPKLFKGYLELELQLREFNHCHKIFQKYLEYDPVISITWIKYAELEALLGDVERSPAIYNFAINQPLMDMPEVLWKSFIDFETEQGE
uniref:Suppressor of forked domain-containing protein n=1 Tax=Amphimedon queenslandica TaxID=400682 RepID=A0A1X7U4V3_AMPQE